MKWFSPDVCPSVPLMNITWENHPKSLSLVRFWPVVVKEVFFYLLSIYLFGEKRLLTLIEKKVLIVCIILEGSTNYFWFIVINQVCRKAYK